MTISNYSTTDSSNNGAVPNGAPSGMLPSDVIDVFRRMMADQRTQWNDAQWFDYLDGTKSGVASYVSSSQFKITGVDATAHYHVGRRVKISDGSGTVYASITAVTFGSGATTVTVDQTLTSPVSAVYTSVLSSNNDALPREAIQDIVGAMLTGNTTSAIDVTYQDSDGTIDFEVTSLATDNNFTDAYKTKLDGIEASANNYVHPSGDGNLHVPANSTTNAGKVLTASATPGTYTWETPASSSDENYTTAEKNKLAGIEASANNYVHPTSTGNKHVPSGGSANQFLKYSADGTAVWSNPDKIALAAITSVDTTCFIPLVGNAATTPQDMFIDNTQFTYNASTAVVTAVDYTATSDLRLKKNIEDMPVNWEKFNLYKAVNHEWKEGREGVFPGFIAQEMEAVNPALVESTGEDKILSVNYAKLAPEIVTHIQDLHRRITELEAKQ